MANLISAERIAKAYGPHVLLDGVSLGVGEGERIGIVGRNGAGKSTLLSILAGESESDSGRVARTSGLRAGYLAQSDSLHGTVGQIAFGGRAWERDAMIRSVKTELLTDLSLDADAARLSGGERRRVALTALLAAERDVLLLDEPTNHLDIEAIDWLGRHLRDRGCAVVVVSHDRWLLDTVCDQMWEVDEGKVYPTEGGYSAYVLQRAERAAVAEADEQRRRNLARKELAWLRRGPQARGTKPKFRVQAANALIAAEPPARDTAELTQMATARLGKTVLELEDVTVTMGSRTLLGDVTWRLGPADRVGIVGINGAGKTTLLRLLAGETPAAATPPAAPAHVGGTGVGGVGVSAAGVGGAGASAAGVGGVGAGAAAVGGAGAGATGVGGARVGAAGVSGSGSGARASATGSGVGVGGADGRRTGASGAGVRGSDVSGAGSRAGVGGSGVSGTGVGGAVSESPHSESPHSEMSGAKSAPDISDISPDGGIGGFAVNGKIVRGKTVRIGHLSQELTELDPAQRVRDSVEEIKLRIQVGKRELSAGQLLERLGFYGDRQRTPIRDLSGGEKRRLQMLRLLMTEPNVLLLDEPTNDLDIEMLNEFEDILDGWPGPLVVVSHDRYFLERVTDRVLALLGDGKLSFLGGGVDEYLERSRARRAALANAGGARAAGTRDAGASAKRAAGASPSGGSGAARTGAGGTGIGGAGTGATGAPAALSPAEQRTARKELQRLERQIARASEREATLHEQLAANATDYEKLTGLGTELSKLQSEKSDLEERWLELAADLEG